MSSEEGTADKETGLKPKVRIITPIEGREIRPQMASQRTNATFLRACTYHPSNPALYICSKCSNPLCINCALPYGHLFLCPHCHEAPPQQQKTEEESSPKLAFEHIIGFFGSIIIIIGLLFLPWASAGYVPPDFNGNQGMYTGLDIAQDYPEVSLVLIIGILLAIMEFLLMMLTTSPQMVSKPPLGVRILPMFLAIMSCVVMIEVVFRAETLFSNIHFGWFACLISACVIVIIGVVEIVKHYRVGD
jgi:hypothetical protein